MGLPLCKTQCQVEELVACQSTDQISHEEGSLALAENRFESMQPGPLNLDAMCVRLGGTDLNAFFSFLGQ